MTVFEVVKGDGPVILAMPHGGKKIPEDVRESLNDNGRKLADTDWHIARLYQGLLPNATTVKANFHRYVIDANRDPRGQSLYPGQNTTELCPTTDFDGQAIYHTGQEPSGDEQNYRVATFHKPYHDALREQINRIIALHGIAVVYDCHSIRSRIPFLFAGELPALNIGTNGGVTCDPRIEQVTLEIARTSPFSTVLNGRFKGGWTTRHYGQPHAKVHAIQMETAQSAYLSAEQAPWRYDEKKAEALRLWLGKILYVIAEEALALRRKNSNA